uniref:Uncharacterized protein n=1 Tax=Myotis myotis TaxID=51298 RepID=A0A7J7XIM8_MYOMY|nr:hypothetical protein mMyoMyo1_011716 [Myotis myotis]
MQNIVASQSPFESEEIDKLQRYFAEFQIKLYKLLLTVSSDTEYLQRRWGVYSSLNPGTLRGTGSVIGADLPRHAPPWFSAPTGSGAEPLSMSSRIGLRGCHSALGGKGLGRAHQKSPEQLRG